MYLGMCKIGALFGILLMLALFPVSKEKLKMQLALQHTNCFN